jgi:hypothetical protein
MPGRAAGYPKLSPIPNEMAVILNQRLSWYRTFNPSPTRRMLAEVERQTGGSQTPRRGLRPNSVVIVPLSLRTGARCRWVLCRGAAQDAA